MQFIFFLILAVIFVILMFLRTNVVYADISDYLNATIKISICGNEIVEGGEDCEGEDLGEATCESLGYGPGTLSCDIACSFNTYECSPAPTPTPTPTSTPTTASTSEVSVSSSPTPTTPETVTPTVSQLLIANPALLFFLNSCDPNGDGKIVSKETFMTVKCWVEEWRQFLLEDIALVEKGSTSKKERKCDLNKDYRCELKDFSILMSYVEK